MTAFHWGPSTVHKFDLPLEGATLPLSPSAKVVLVAMQDGVLRLWARRVVDSKGRPSFSGDGRRFEVYGTGKVLSGLVKRIAAGTSATPVGTPAEVAAFTL